MWWLDAESPSHPTNSSETLKYGDTQPRELGAAKIHVTFADSVANRKSYDKANSHFQKQLASKTEEAQS